MQKQNDRLADQIYQLHQVIRRKLLHVIGRRKPEFGLGKVIKYWVSQFAFVGCITWPLRILLGLRPTAQRIGGRMATRPNLLHVLGGAGRSQLTIQTRNIGCPPSARKIHHEDRVTLVNKIIGPAWPAVWRLQQGDAGLSPACLYEQDRIRIDRKSTRLNSS